MTFSLIGLKANPVYEKVMSVRLSIRLVARLSLQAKSRNYRGVTVFKVKCRVKTRQVKESGLNNWSKNWSQQSERTQAPPPQRGGGGSRCLEGSLLACHTRCKCSMETTHKVIKLVESLIGWEVIVGQGSECHLKFMRGRLHIVE